MSVADKMTGPVASVEFETRKLKAYWTKLYLLIAAVAVVSLVMVIIVVIFTMKTS